jgi:tRNA-binding protein
MLSGKVSLMDSISPETNASAATPTTVQWDDFTKIDLRIGTICRVAEFPAARQPAYQLWIDLGELGIKRSSAQITRLYTTDQLVGKQVICVCNFPPKQIGTFLSEVLVTGAVLADGEVVLAQPERTVPNGTRLA